jgi:hypothetical protein
VQSADPRLGMQLDRERVRDDVQRRAVSRKFVIYRMVLFLRISIVSGGSNVRTSQRPLRTSGVSSMVLFDMTCNNSMTILATPASAAPVPCAPDRVGEERFDDQALAERCAS